MVGDMLGFFVGSAEGFIVGDMLGFFVGSAEGLIVGDMLGFFVGSTVGSGVASFTYTFMAPLGLVSSVHEFWHAQFLSPPPTQVIYK